MKLRIKDDSIRLRLTKGEVKSLHIEGRVVSTAQFGPNKFFIYQVVACDSLPQMEATFEGNLITVKIPKERVSLWAQGQQVSMIERPNENNFLKILVEKDFACLKPREGEDDSDAFAHPLASH